MSLKTERKPDTSKMRAKHEWMEIQTLLDRVFPGDFLEWEEGLQRKREDKHYDSLVKSIQEEGLKTPVFIETGNGEDRYLGNGHHRLAALIDLGYTHIPYTEEFSIGWGLEDGGEEDEND